MRFKRHKQKEILVGDRYGRWVVLEKCVPNISGDMVCLCRCDCGTEKAVHANSLVSGKSKSCRCLQRELLGAHKDWASIEYKTWGAMKYRCEDKSNTKYGGRGIGVCDSWKESYDVFLSDMGRKPSPTLSIERIDNDDGYYPGNCKWATPMEQGRNKRNSRFVTIRGRREIIAEWARIAGIGPGVIRRRLKRNWSNERAVFTPVR